MCEVQVYVSFEYFQMLHLHSGLYHILMNSVNFWGGVNSLTLSGREFQIFGPNVIRLFWTNVFLP